MLAVSPVYETAPVGGPAQPDYLNAVLIAATGLPPRDLLDAAAPRSRRRSAGSGRNGSDRAPSTSTSSAMAASVSGDPVLTLPHPRAHERAFVLAPWHDIDPDAELPGRGPVGTAAGGLDRDGVHQVPGAGPAAPRARPGGPVRRHMRPTRTSHAGHRRRRLRARWPGCCSRSVYERLPPLPWTGVPALLIAAAARGLDGPRPAGPDPGGRRGRKPAAPLFVSRMVALAKASSLAAAVIAGLAAGFVIYLSGSLNAAVPRQDALTAAVTLASAVVLACAALFLEYCCRVPNAPDRETSEDQARLP